MCIMGLLDCLTVEGLEIGRQKYAIPGSVVMDLKKTRVFPLAPSQFVLNALCMCLFGRFVCNDQGN